MNLVIRKDVGFMCMKVYCKPQNGIHPFYLKDKKDEYYLFSQDYRKGVQAYYGNEVHLDRAIDYSKCHRDSALARTMTKLPAYIKYIEKEYEINVLKQTIKKKAG